MKLLSYFCLGITEISAEKKIILLRKKIANTFANFTFIKLTLGYTPAKLQL